MIFHVKICGIRRLPDALLAHAYGADAIGILVGQKHISSDFVTKEEAKMIVKGLPMSCSSVLVTHLADADSIAEMAKFIRPSCVQLHGESTMRDIRTLRKEFPEMTIIRSVHVVDRQSVEEVHRLEGEVDAVLIDTIDLQADKVGGTGKTHDWNISAEIVASCAVPIILAGGLHPENVADAIRIVRPYGVDVNSGTKGADGYKDAEKLRLFIERAKEAFEKNNGATHRI